MATDSGQNLVAKVLLDFGASADLRDLSRRTAFQAALQNGHYELAVRLAWVSQPLPSWKAKSDLLYELRKALRNGDHELVFALAHMGACVGAGHGELEEALRTACQCNDVRLVEALTKLGVDVNAEDRFKHTPLISAAYTTCDKVVEHLLGLGSVVNVDAQDCNGRTALMLAMQNGSKDIVAQLLRAGASLEVRDERGCTALRRLRKASREDMERFAKSLGFGS
eukprot:UN0881